MKLFFKPGHTISKSYTACPNCPSGLGSVIGEDIYDPDTGDFMFSDWWCSDCGLIGEEDTFIFYKLISVPIKQKHITKINLVYL
jgi:hypothetical protein